jgi:hypothetical protein
LRNFTRRIHRQIGKSILSEAQRDCHEAFRAIDVVGILTGDSKSDRFLKMFSRFFLVATLKDKFRDIVKTGGTPYSALLQRELFIRFSKIPEVIPPSVAEPED